MAAAYPLPGVVFMQNAWPLVGISCGLDWAEQNFYLREHYAAVLTAAGAAALILPATECSKARLAELAAGLAGRLDGLLLSGGGDFRPQLWGEYPHFAPGRQNEQERLMEQGRRREDWELALLAAFRQVGKPVLGVCRGMQLLNIGLGGSLWQDLAERSDSLAHWQSQPPEQPCHLVRLAGWLAEALQRRELAVNSFHHQGVRRLGWGLSPLALAADGLIEAVGNSQGGQFLLGVQWHPERLRDEASWRIWQLFVAVCKKNSSNFLSTVL